MIIRVSALEGLPSGLMLPAGVGGLVSLVGVVLSPGRRLGLPARPLVRPSPGRLPIPPALLVSLMSPLGRPVLLVMAKLLVAPPRRLVMAVLLKILVAPLSRPVMAILVKILVAPFHGLPVMPGRILTPTSGPVPILRLDRRRQQKNGGESKADD